MNVKIGLTGILSIYQFFIFNLQQKSEMKSVFAFINSSFPYFVYLKGGNYNKNDRSSITDHSKIQVDWDKQCQHN